MHELKYNPKLGSELGLGRLFGFERIKFGSEDKKLIHKSIEDTLWEASCRT
jgi:hypothetical protein